MHQWDPYRTPRHVTGRARALRPLPRIPAAARFVTTRAEREFVGNPNHVLKPYRPQDYLNDADRLPVRSVVHVEAAWLGEPETSVDETRWVSTLPWNTDGAPDLGAIVVHADPRWKACAAILDEHLSVTGLVRGVRHSVSHHDDPQVRDFETSPDVLAQPDFIDGFAAIAERGLSFELWLYAHQIPTARRLVREYPDTRFVFCHYGTPVGLLGRRGKHTARTTAARDRILQTWRADVAGLAEHPNVVAKHSGLGMPLLGRAPLRRLTATRLAQFADQVAPLVRHLHDCFGPNRTMWASNYPMDKPCLTLPATAQIVLDVLGSDADPAQLFHGVAAQTYRIPPIPQPSGSPPAPSKENQCPTTP